MIHTLLFISLYIGGLLRGLAAQPIIIFCVYQVVYFFNPSERWWGSNIPDFSYSFPVAVILLLVAIKAKFNNDFNSLPLSTPIIKWLGFFLICFSLVSFYAIFEERHLIQVEYFIKAYIILCAAYILANDKKKITWLIESYIFGAFYLAFYAYQLGRNSGDRIHGIGVLDSSDSNSVAVSLIPAALFALHYLFFEKNIYRRCYYGLACVFIANALVLINSRGAMLGMGIGGAYYLYQISRSGSLIRYAKAKAIGLILVSLSGSLYLMDDSATQRFYSIFESSTDNVERENGATRVHFWKAAIDMAEDYPLGLGYRGFNAYADFYIPEEVNTGRSRSRSVHSSWFEALSETGYIGLTILLYLSYLSFKLSGFVKKFYKQTNQLQEYLFVVALQAGLVATYIGMTFISRMRGETFLWLLIFVACLYEIAKREKALIKNENK